MVNFGASNLGVKGDRAGPLDPLVISPPPWMIVPLLHMLAHEREGVSKWYTGIPMGNICGEKLRDVLLNFLAMYTTITQFGKFGKKWKKPDNIPLLYGGPYKLDSKFTGCFKLCQNWMWNSSLLKKIWFIKNLIWVKMRWHRFPAFGLFPTRHLDPLLVNEWYLPGTDSPRETTRSCLRRVGFSASREGRGGPGCDQDGPVGSDRLRVLTTVSWSERENIHGKQNHHGDFH